MIIISKALLGFLFILTWLVLNFTVISGWIRGLEIALPTSIYNWLLYGPIPLFAGLSSYLTDNANFKKNARDWQAASIGFSIWLIILIVMPFLQAQISSLLVVPLGFLFMVLLVIFFRIKGGLRQNDI